MREERGGREGRLWDWRMPCFSEAGKFWKGLHSTGFLTLGLARARTKDLLP